MALQTVIYPQDQFNNYGYNKVCHSLVGGGYGFGLDEDDDQAILGILNNNNSNNMKLQGLHAKMTHHKKEWDPNYSSPEANCTTIDDQSLHQPPEVAMFPKKEPPTSEAADATGRRKRRRTRSAKNKEELENQRMTHIAVERNRRKQMNEYLAVIRSLMPPSYVQRGDQASIIGGAINFVKELEQLLQTVEARRRIKQQQQQLDDDVDQYGFSTSPFSEFFSFPQYSTRAEHRSPAADSSSIGGGEKNRSWAVADIEVTMVESHASLKILSKKRPRQLLRLVAGLQTRRLSVLHLNLTTLDQMVLYSISVKVEEGCHLNTVDEIAAFVNQLLQRIEEEEEEEEEEKAAFG